MNLICERLVSLHVSFDERWKMHLYQALGQHRI